jgi:acetyltransferase-like isoleucine patch superfamily enzyme
MGLNLIANFKLLLLNATNTFTIMNRLLSRMLTRFFTYKRARLKKRFDRVLPANELFTDRWEKAKYLGFGKETSVYDSATFFGDVKVGERTWIGPHTILDGTGGLIIGNNCGIGPGVYIYTHDTVAWTLSGGKHPYRYKPVTIGDNCFVGSQSIIYSGVTIGTSAMIMVNSVVSIDVPDRTIVGGSPAKIIGEVILSDDAEPVLKFFSNGK